MLEDKEYLKKYFKTRKNKDGPKLFLSKIDYIIFLIIIFIIYIFNKKIFI